MTEWGPTGELVYNRTYSRTKPDGNKETWRETVERVVDGNLALAPEEKLLPNERDVLIEFMTNFKVIPAGRHLWASGVKGRQFLFNCHVSGWGDALSNHFQFSFMRLMEGGGVGANYSNKYLEHYPDILHSLKVHIVCDSEHPDYEDLKDAGVLSTEYDPDWPGAFGVEDSREGWADSLVDLLETFYRPDVSYVNRVYDVSRVRAKGSRLKTFGGSASGPLPLAVMLRDVADVMNRHRDGKLSGLGAMEIDHAVARCVVSGGNRRSARMSIMNWDDPQIEEFIRCKSDQGKHWTTNISVAVNDQFYYLAETGNVLADKVLRMISEGMLTNGEPGVWNYEFSNRGEPNEVQATNPCGEIALEPWENCNLGHINLAAFVRDDGVDLAALLLAHMAMTRFLMRATYGDVTDSKQLEVLKRNRRIGVGHFGFASFIAKLGIKYSDAAESEELKNLLSILSESVTHTAAHYAHELRIPVPVKTRTIAPTGTIAKLPGVSEGIHPIFSKYFIRRIRLSTVDEEQRQTLDEYGWLGYSVEPCRYAPNTEVVAIPTKETLLDEVATIYGEEKAEEIVQSADDLTLAEMLSVQELYQQHWADNAVSFTANVYPSRYSEKNIYEHLILFGETLKGFTIFPELSMPQSPYERISKEEYESSGFGAVSDSIDENCVSGACPVR